MAIPATAKNVEVYISYSSYGGKLATKTIIHITEHDKMKDERDKLQYLSNGQDIFKGSSP